MRAQPPYTSSARVLKITAPKLDKRLYLFKSRIWHQVGAPLYLSCPNIQIYSDAKHVNS